MCFLFKRNKNEVEINNTYSVQCRVSIQTIWATKRESRLRQVIQNSMNFIKVSQILTNTY